jgi:hypothetical protein
MKSLDVQLIIDTYNSRDWSHLYEVHNTNWSRNIWFKIGNISEFDFVKDLINNDLKNINTEYNVTNWLTFLIYNKNDFFGVHTDDTFNYGNSNKQPIYTGGYILNNDFEGGEFIIENKKLEIDIGELFLFKRHVKHEVLKIKNGIRYSLHFGVEKQIKKSMI